jgi:hypothetical protein
LLLKGVTRVDMTARRDHEPGGRADAWVESTQLFKALTDIETEIMEQRWAEMQRSGHDVDWDRAVVHWTIHRGHRLNKPRT